MNRQKREQLIGGSSKSSGKTGRAEHPEELGREREQVKGSESSNEPQKKPGQPRQPGRMPLPD